MTESPIYQLQATKVLVCPLDWGLGHATRCIPIIRILTSRGIKVVVACSPQLKPLFINEVPELELDTFEGARIRYSRSSHLVPRLLADLPLLLLWYFRERRITKTLVTRHKADCIISDNRYGVRQGGIKNILITHQLAPIMPRLLKWAEPIAAWVFQTVIKSFDECWVPDLPMPDSLAGLLVHRYPLPYNVRFIGPQSRFTDCDKPDIFRSEYQQESTSANEYELLGIVSGPEPQRSILLDIMIRQFSTYSGKSLILTGRPEQGAPKIVKTDQGPDLAPHLETAQLKALLTRTPYIVCRSGYSTIMDLYYLGRSAIIIPTPGQTEQEYLSQYHSSRHLAISQDEFVTVTLSSLLERLLRL